MSLIWKGYILYIKFVRIKLKITHFVQGIAYVDIEG